MHICLQLCLMLLSNSRDLKPAAFCLHTIYSCTSLQLHADVPAAVLLLFHAKGQDLQNNSTCIAGSHLHAIH